MVSHGVDFTGVCFNGEDGTKCIVRGVSLDSDRSIRDPMSDDRCGGKGGLQEFEGTPSLVHEIPRSSFRVSRVSGTTMSEYPEINLR